MSIVDQLRRGSSVVLVLKLLSTDQMYGYQISNELEARSEGYFTMRAGLLYPTLHRMERDGLIIGQWRMVGNRQRKYYEITSQGKAYLDVCLTEWHKFADKLFDILDTDGSISSNGNAPGNIS